MKPDMPQEGGIPLLGFGTSNLLHDDIEAALTYAVEVGYRSFDCANVYGNEKEIGRVLSALISSGAVRRDQLYITSKLWSTYHHRDDVLPALRRTLNDLQLDYLDLYLIHWPYCFQRGDVPFPTDSDGQLLYDNIDYLETWKGMEKAKELKLVNNIGLSNFNSQQIQRIIDNCKIRPMNNQVEVHVYFSQEDLVRYCQSRDIAITAYCPLSHFTPPDDPCKPNVYTNNTTKNLFKEDTLVRIGSGKGKTSAQVALRWLVQRNIIAIPKSRQASRIKENIQIFDFELTSDEMKQIDDMKQGQRIVAPYSYNDKGERELRDGKAPYYPFKLNEESFF